jgi:hypothetical protein
MAEVEPLFRAALGMPLRLFPGDHPDVARGVSNLALGLQARGALVEAEPLCRAAFAMYLRLFPSDHPDVARSLTTLWYVMQAQEGPTDAELLSRDAQLLADLRNRVALGQLHVRLPQLGHDLLGRVLTLHVSASQPRPTGCLP